MCRAISIAQIVVGVAFIVLSYGKLSTPATTVLCTVTFFGVLASWYRKDVAAGIMFATSTAWLMQICDAFAYFIIFQYFITNILVYAVCMSVLLLTNLFLADYLWAKTNGKAFKPKRLCFIVAFFALLPALSYVYRSHDIDGVEYHIAFSSTKLAEIVFTNGTESTPPIAIDNMDVLRAIANNSDHDTANWYCDNCRIRVKTFFTKISKIELVKNLSNNTFYDDIAELPINDDGRYKALTIKLEDLWW